MKGTVYTPKKSMFLATSIKPFQFLLDKKTKSDVIHILDVSKSALVGKNLVAYTAFAQRDLYHYYGSKCNTYPTANCDLIVSSNSIAIQTIRTINPNEELMFANDGLYNLVEPVNTIGTSKLYSGFCIDHCKNVLQTTIPENMVEQSRKYITTLWAKYHENKNSVCVILAYLIICSSIYL